MSGRWNPAEPVYIITTDKGFLGDWLQYKRCYGHWKAYTQVGTVSFEKKEWSYDWAPLLPDGTKDWKHKKRITRVKWYIDKEHILKRKTLKSIEHHLEKCRNNYGKKGENRFPNPKILYIKDLNKFLEYCKNGQEVDYNIWNY